MSLLSKDESAVLFMFADKRNQLLLDGREAPTIGSEEGGNHEEDQLGFDHLLRHPVLELIPPACDLTSFSVSYIISL
jgi:hypothetical protein